MGTSIFKDFNKIADLVDEDPDSIGDTSYAPAFEAIVAISLAERCFARPQNFPTACA
ncbi:hypothetical protein ABWH74_002723 [Burkholderia vietnamiensis]|uniref:hypothetical protein n=1 Tax=Burkholderia vietnamiensis TaxID=60552 RepID=UPI00158D27CC|nr:hypothetical protein [Burkholderia vietnamiensis]MBR8282820.1 hypothetical protein [Burkholderia vietnamiensis]MCA8195705.1 hypothetical protein [Burkholderia vietnamiensis]MDN7412318.1 hypothetical protein [Burkholderia vietnamiensis]QTK83700.1 hypothetical protein J4D21_09905 [Burkholderia vietnamiensis]HDR9318699.1 hypothetical protein [Burkholderia vietnamiensis]